MADFLERFEALSMPLSHLSNEVMESTFLNGLDPEIKVKLLSYELGPDYMYGLLDRR